MVHLPLLLPQHTHTHTHTHTDTHTQTHTQTHTHRHTDTHILLTKRAKLCKIFEEIYSEPNMSDNGPWHSPQEVLRTCVQSGRGTAWFIYFREAWDINQIYLGNTLVWLRKAGQLKEGLWGSLQVIGKFKHFLIDGWLSLSEDLGSM